MNRSKSRLYKLVVPALMLGATTLSADPTISSTRIFSEPRGAAFYVDGQRFVDSATFLWPQGSKHTLNVDPVQQDPMNRTQYLFHGWTNSTGLPCLSQIITADPGITWYKASFSLQYAVSLNFFTCPA